MKEKMHFTSVEDFTNHLNTRYGKEIGRVIRNQIEYTGNREKPVMYTYWEHDGTPNNITFYQSLADQEFPSAIQQTNEEEPQN